MNCRKYFPQDYDSFARPEDRTRCTGWLAQYVIEDGPHKGKPYNVEFSWPECPVSALTHNRGDFDPIGLIHIINEARNVGGKGAVMTLCKRDPRMYDAASVIESCHSAEFAARQKKLTERVS